MRRRGPDRPLAEIIDRPALQDRLDALARAHTGDAATLNAAAVPLLKAALREGRARIRAWFEEDRLGTGCARQLAHLEDEIIRAIHAFAVRQMAGGGSAGRLAVVAVGGYGRGTLAPGSDIDLLFLLPPAERGRKGALSPAAGWGERVAETMLYLLWDLGQKVGHATRTVDDCLALARADMTIRTTLLEARPLAGDHALASTLAERFDREIVQATGPDFVAAKLKEREARILKAGTSRYRVEPNVKEGKGGLRDLNTLFWIAKYVYRVREPSELAELGLFTRRELHLFERAEDFLWATRCALHFITGRAEDRLTFELQRDIAATLDYADRPGLRGVERFMKHYFLVAKDVGDLSAIVTAAIEEREARPRSAFARLVAPFKRSERRSIAGTRDFVAEAGRLNVADEGVFERDGVNLLRLFHWADRTGLEPHPVAMRLVTRSLRLIDGPLRESLEANRLFLEVLASPRDPETVLRRMNEAGVLGRFIPEFGRVVAMMQFNMYHHYTVDEHLLRSVGELSEIEHGTRREETPLASEIMPVVQSRTALYVATFLHDIAKGLPEDHSAAGGRMARSICPRLGLTPADTETVAWLVEHHLVMSLTAQHRDLADRKTIETFAAVVQSPERLRLLLILTTADIRAVGPGVWNGWKGQLLRTLYWETEPVLAGGHSLADRRARVAAAQGETRAALADWEPDVLEAHLGRLYPPYWLKTDLDRRLRHAGLLARAGREGRSLATEVSTEAFRGVTELTVLAPDHPRLLSTIAGACAAQGANIVDAAINTTTDGLALDVIVIGRAFRDDEDELRRAGRIAAQMERALAGEVRLPEAIARKAGAKKAADVPRIEAFEVAPQVIVANEWSNLHTVVELQARDRPGLLYEVTSALSALSLNIASAHVATFGERATDVFYVTDLTGAKVTNPERQGLIRRRLLAVLGGGQGADEAGPPAATAAEASRPAEAVG